MTKTIFNLNDFVDGETASMVSLTQPSIEFMDLIDDFKPYWQSLIIEPENPDETAKWEAVKNNSLILIKSKYGEIAPDENISWKDYFKDIHSESVFEMKVYSLYQHRRNKLARLFFLDRIEVEDNQSFENDEWARYTHTFQTKIPLTNQDDYADPDKTNEDLPDIGLTHNMFPIEKLRTKSIYSSQAILPGLTPKEIYNKMNSHGVYSALASKLPLPKFDDHAEENSGQFNEFAFLGGKTYFLTTYNSLTNLVKSTSFKTAAEEIPYVQLLNIDEADYNRIDHIISQTNFFQAFNPNTDTSKIIEEYKNWFNNHSNKILINPDLDIQFNQVSYLSYIGKYSYEFSPSANGIHLVSLIPSLGEIGDLVNSGSKIDASLISESIIRPEYDDKIHIPDDGKIDLTEIKELPDSQIAFVADLGVYDNHYEPNTPHWLYIKIPFIPLSDFVYLKFSLQFNSRNQAGTGNQPTFETKVFGSDGYLGAILQLDDNSRNEVKFFTYGSDSLKSGDTDYIQENFDENSTCSFYSFLRKGKVYQADGTVDEGEIDDPYRVAHALADRNRVEFQIKIPVDLENQEGHTFKIGFISNIDTSDYQDSYGYLDTQYDVVKNTIQYCGLAISNIQIINPGMEANPEQKLSWANYINSAENQNEMNSRASDFFTVSRIVNDLPYQKVVECNMNLRTTYNKKLFCPFTSADVFADTFTTKSFEDAMYKMDVSEDMENGLFKFNSHRKYSKIMSCGNKLSLIYQDQYTIPFQISNEQINKVPTFKMIEDEEEESSKFKKSEGLNYGDLTEKEKVVPVRFQKIETIDRINRFDNSIKHKANIFSVHVKNSGVKDYEKSIQYKRDNKLISQEEYEHKLTLINSVRKQITNNIKQISEKLAPATNQLIKVFID